MSDTPSPPRTTRHPLVYFGALVHYDPERHQWVATTHAETHQGTPYGPVAVSCTLRARYAVPPEGQPHGGARMALDALLAQIALHGIACGYQDPHTPPALTYQPTEGAPADCEDVVRREADRLGWTYVPADRAWPAG